jgi:hypothetical protein
MSKEKKPLSEEELAKILELIAKAYEKAGKKISTAMSVTDIKDGEVVGEMLIDNRDEDKDLN